MSAITRALDEVISDHFGGDGTAALLALAEHRGIAVAWMDRDVLAREFAEHDVTLTDALWEQVEGKLGGFDAYAGDVDVNVHTGYAESILRELGIKNDRGEDLHL